MKKKNRTDSLWADAFRRFKRNKLAMFGFAMICILILCAIFAPLVAPYHYDYQSLDETFCAPSWKHLFGTDSLGRDIFSRVIYGTRTSLSISAATVLIATILGGALGAVAAYYGGPLDNTIMRFLDIFLAIPSTLLAIAIAAALGAGIGKHHVSHYHWTSARLSPSGSRNGVIYQRGRIYSRSPFHWLRYLAHFSKACPS